MKISIITVTFNSEANIARCIKSVYEQSWPEIEHILIDGASTDDTVAIAQSLPNRIARLISEPDRGIYDAINKGIGLATGDVIGILNSDDVLIHPEVITTIAHAFLNNNIQCLYGNLVYTNQNNKIVRVWTSRAFRSGLFERSWTPAHPTFYCRKDAYNRFGLYKINYIIAADVELMLRFLEVQQLRSLFINEFFVNMRHGGVSTQGLKSTWIITKELKRAFGENGLPFNLIKYSFFKLLKYSQVIQTRHVKNIQL